MSQATTPHALHRVVVTPEATALDTRADFVTLPLYLGECGIAPQHSPLIDRLGFGELRIRSGGDQLRYYVEGGFVQVADDILSVSFQCSPAVPFQPTSSERPWPKSNFARRSPAARPAPKKRPSATASSSKRGANSAWPAARSSRRTLGTVPVPPSLPCCSIQPGQAAPPFRVPQTATSMPNDCAMAAFAMRAPSASSAEFA